MDGEAARNDAGCDHCRNTGYFGRVGLHRFMPATPGLRTAIRNGDHETIRKLVDDTCGNDLVEQAEQLILRGITTRAEVQRVLATGEGLK